MQGLSILIPTFGFACYDLVHDLQQQCKTSVVAENYEIRVIDDGSKDEKSLLINKKINQLPNCQFIEQKENTGKSALLNQQVKESHYPLLLFIDCDAKVCSDNFIDLYLESAEKADVVCGTIVTSPEYSRPDNQLRFRYEMAAARIRKPEYYESHPYEHFTTFNVLMRKTVFDYIQFDADVKRYGYEDTIFGLELKRHCISICHIQNPLIHTGIDNNAQFLHKTELALQNLSKQNDDIQQCIKVSQTALRLKNWGLAPLARLLFRLSKKSMRRQLEGKTPNLHLFSLYKLGYFLNL